MPAPDADGQWTAASTARQAQLIAAANAVRAWIHVQRIGWSAAPPAPTSLLDSRAGSLALEEPAAERPARPLPEVQPDLEPAASPVPPGTVHPGVHRGEPSAVGPPVAPTAHPDTTADSVGEVVGARGRAEPESQPVGPMPPPVWSESRLPAVAEARLEPVGAVDAPVVPGSLLNLRSAVSLEPTGPDAADVPAATEAGSRSLARLARGLAAAATAAALGVGAWYGVRAYRMRPPARGSIAVESAPAGLDVWIDGKPQGKAPLSAAVAPGRHVVELRRRAEVRTMMVDVAPGRTAVARLDWNTLRMGRLRVDSTPPGAKVTLDGKARGVTPLLIDEIAAGTHVLLIQTSDGVIRRSVAVAADRTTEISESIYPGWLHVSSPLELAITEGGRPLSADERNQMLLPAGSHTLQLENRALGYRETRSVEIRPGEVTRIAVEPPPSTLTVTSTTPAEVMIDGEHVGATPLAGVPIKLGTRDIVVRSSSGAERRITLTVTAAPARIDVDFSKP